MQESSGWSLGTILAEGLSLGVVGVDGEYRVRHWNTWMERHSGIKAADILGDRLCERFPDIPERNKEIFLHQCIEHQRTVFMSPLIHHYLIPLDIVRADETVRMFQNVRIFPASDGNQGCVAWIVIQDGTEQIQYGRELLTLNQQLNQQREWLEVTLMSIGDAVIVTDADKAITMMNPLGEQLTGWSLAEAKGRPIDEIFRIMNEQTRKGVKSPIDAVLRDGFKVGLANHSVLLTRDGREIPIGDSAAPIRDSTGKLYGVVLVFRDVTEHQRMERELVRMERLHAIGELAAGVAHNLNNMLTTVLGPAHLLLRYSDDPRIRREAEAILASGQRARDLVLRLNLSVQGTAAERLQDVLVNNVVQAVVQAARPRWKDAPEARGIRIEVVTDLAEVPPVWGTETGLHDVLLNLLVNAVDAMPHGGTITLGTQQVGETVQLTIRDTGIGMDEKTRQRVFEPFFTTKMDVGTGLGLSTTYATLTSWGGSIEVESSPREGALFVLRLPISRETEAPAAARPAQRRSRPGKVLIVEDDEGIEQLLMQLLTGEHEVGTTRSGREALEGFAPGRYDVALIDLGMPGMPGDQVARELRLADPFLATVLITGWLLREDDLRLDVFDFQLPKPFDDLERVEDVVVRAIELHDERASGTR